MKTDNVSTLKIHKLTQAQYDRALASGNIDENALYLTPDEEVDLSGYATKEDLEDKANSEHTHNIDDVNDLRLKLDEKADTAYLNENFVLKSEFGDVDLSDYETKEDAEGKLNAAKEYTNEAIKGKADAVHNHDERYYIKSEIDAALSGKSNTDHNHDTLYCTESEINDKLSDKADYEHSHDDEYDKAGAALGAQKAAEGYTDEAVEAVKNDLLGGAGTAYDTLKKLGELIAAHDKETDDALEVLNDVAAGKADKDHNHTIANVTNLQDTIDDINSKFDDCQKLSYPGVTIAEGTDILTLGKGEYRCVANSVVQTLVNCPTNVNFKLTVEERQGEARLLYTIKDSSANVYVNSISGDNTWAGWKKLANNDDVTNLQTQIDKKLDKTTGGNISGSVNIENGANYIHLSISRLKNNKTHTAALLPSSDDGSTILTHQTDGVIDNQLTLSPTATYLNKPLAIESGGTGATDAATARTNLGITPDNIGAAKSAHTHSIANVTNLQSSLDERALSSEHNIKHYYAFSQIGLTDGTETIQTIASSMPDASVLTVFIGDGCNTAIYPSQYGLLTVTKWSAYRTRFEFSAHTDNKHWLGVCYNETFYGWHEVYTENHLPTLADLGVTATAAELNKLDGVTATTAELNYVDGVTSNIQTQLNGKQATISGGATTIASSNLTANRALISNANGKVGVSAVTSTELGYLDGVTSNVQTQLDGKSASGHTHNYAGSSSAGGAATTALACTGNAATATQVYETLTNPTTGTTYYVPFHDASSASGNKSLRTNDGFRYWSLNGTTSAIGHAQLGLGNSTPSGTAGNKTGSIYIYGNSSGYTQIVPTNNTTSNININLPSNGGTLALTTDTVNSAITLYSYGLNGNSSSTTGLWNPFTWVINTAWGGTTGIYGLQDTENSFNGIFSVKFRTGANAYTHSVGDVKWLCASSSSLPEIKLTYVSDSTNSKTTYRLYISVASSYRTYKISKITEIGTVGTFNAAQVSSVTGTEASKSSLTYANEAGKVYVSTNNPSSEVRLFPTMMTGSSNTNCSLYENTSMSCAVKHGSTSASGYNYLILGNNTASGTAGNYYGALRLYSNSSGYNDLRCTDCTGAFANYLPASSGTLLNTTNYSSYALPLSGGTMTGNIVVPYGKGIIQHQRSDSNYTSALCWYKGGTSQASYDPQIGQHNTGGDGTGAISIVPYATDSSPWEGNVGLYIKKGGMTLDGSAVLTASNYGDYTLPRTAGASYPLTGALYFKTNAWTGNILSTNASGQKRWELYSNSNTGAVAATVLRTYSNTDGSSYANYVFGTSGTFEATTIKTSSTNAAKHLEFSRGSINYITAPASGSVAFVMNGKEIGTANSPLVVADGAVYPGMTTNLGMSNNKWANVYATTFHGSLSGNATSATTATTATTAGSCTGNAATATSASQIKVSDTEATSSTYYYPAWTSGYNSTTTYAVRANDGFRYRTLEGTASAAGYGYLYLGNSTATGTAGNKYGGLLLYSQKSGYCALRATDSTGEYVNYLPASSGTLINSNGGTFTGKVTSTYSGAGAFQVTTSSGTTGFQVTRSDITAYGASSAGVNCRIGISDSGNGGIWVSSASGLQPLVYRDPTEENATTKIAGRIVMANAYGTGAPPSSGTRVKGMIYFQIVS